MQGYTYSVFSILAIAIHLIINFDLLFGRRGKSVHVAEYRGFLASVLAYYVVDAAWGVFAGLEWTGLLYVDTIFFFLSLVAFVFMWCRFVVSYLDLGKWPTRFLIWCGYAILAVYVVLLTVNCFNDCFFHIDGRADAPAGRPPFPPDSFQSSRKRSQVHRTRIGDGFRVIR